MPPKQPWSIKTCMPLDPLKVCCGIWHQAVSNRSFISCKLQGGASIDRPCFSSTSHRRSIGLRSCSAVSGFTAARRLPIDVLKSNGAKKITYVTHPATCPCWAPVPGLFLLSGLPSQSLSLPGWAEWWRLSGGEGRRGGTLRVTGHSVIRQYTARCTGGSESGNAQCTVPRCSGVRDRAGQAAEHPQVTQLCYLRMFGPPDPLCPGHPSTWGTVKAD